MFIKNFKLISLGLVLSTAIISSFATQRNKDSLSEKSTSSRQLTQMQTISPIELIDLASTHYKKTCAMSKNSLEQVASFNEVVLMAEQAISALSSNDKELAGTLLELIITLKELKGVSLRQQAAALHNYACLHSKGDSLE